MEVIKKEELYSGFLRLNKFDVRLKNGATIEREIIDKKGGVAIVAVDKEGYIYLTKQPRVGAFLDDSIEVPAGLVENEDPEDAGRRELLEETGCKANKMIHLCRFYGDIACSNSITNIYLAPDVEKVSDTLELDDDEYLERVRIKKEEAYRMLDNGEFKDSHTLIALLKARKYLDI